MIIEDEKRFLVVAKYPGIETEWVSRLTFRYQKALDLFKGSAIKDKYQVVWAEPADFSEYSSAHSPEYIDILKQVESTGKEVAGIFPDAVKFEKSGVGGTLKAALLVNNSDGIAFHLGGGYHHGERNSPKYFDYCNDVAIALYRFLSLGMEKILYIDLDAHYPNGVMNMFVEEPRVFKLSLHEWDSGEKEAWGSNIGRGKGLGLTFNVPVPLYTGDEVYNDLLELVLKEVMKRFTPDCIVYQAGVDTHRSDKIGRLRLSLAGLYERDKKVASLRKFLGVPLLGMMGGGYDEQFAPRAIVNTLAALANQEIIFREEVSYGSTNSQKAFSWLAKTLKFHG